jgi:hypothetical protein
MFANISARQLACDLRLATGRFAAAAARSCRASRTCSITGHAIIYLGTQRQKRNFIARGPHVLPHPAQPPARPNRCQLFGPGSRPALFEKMAASAADVINLDLEDSVAPDDKAEARANVIAAIHEVDWGRKTLSVRINGLDTPFWYRDVVDLLEQAGDRLDQIMIPKVGCAADIYAVDALVTAIEAAKGRGKRIGFEVIIEPPPASPMSRRSPPPRPRLQAMSLGAADFAASMGMQTTGIGGTQENYYMLRDGARNTGPTRGTGRRRHRRRLPHPWRPAGGRPLRRLLG